MRPACARPRNQKKGDFWQNEAKFTNVFNKPRSPSRLKVVARRANGCAGRLAGARPLHAHRMSDCAREIAASAAASSWPFMP